MVAISRGLYGTVWRWHFYAGLCVAPFLVVLSLTGLVYLFNTEIDDALYPDLRFAAASSPSLPPSALVDAAEAMYPGGGVTRIYLPVEPGRTAELFVTTAAGDALRVFVDPAAGRVLGSYVYTETLVGFSDLMHGSLLLGDVGDAIVELAACWAFILVLSGLYLWFPRQGWRNAEWRPRVRARGRVFWRSVHKVTGLYTALLVLFLILSGLPWATIWGGEFLAPLSNAAGLGYPDGTRRSLQSVPPPAPEITGEAPWTVQHGPAPASDPAARCGPADSRNAPCEPMPIGVDAAAEILARAGMKDAYRLSFPRGREGVYMGYTYPDRPEGQRTIQIDQYSGAILGDIAFADYGAVAKAVEWGVAIHMGNYFGRLNQVLMAAACIGIIGSVVTGCVMWWKRRPSGRFGAPARAADRVVGTGMKLLIVVLGVLFPLAGLSMAVICLVDWVLLRTRGHAAE